MAEKTLTQRAIEDFVQGRTYTANQMAAVISEIMEGCSSDAQIAGFLVALRMKGETIDEITGAAQAMRGHARRIEVPGPLFDTCGTGGDGAGTFNVSTATAFVVAGAGVRVAKHGNRSISSRCGSADVLVAAGVNIELPPERMAEAIASLGIGFLFAPLYHGAMKHAAGPRREIAIRSIFNILGPLSNPAGAQYQLLGVFDAKWVEPLAHVLKNLGSLGAMIVHGADGLDELTLTGPSRVAELRGGEVSVYDLDPRDLGFKRVKLHELVGGDAAHNAQLLREILSGQPSPMADMTVFNAAAALRVCAVAADWPEAVRLARQSIASGSALHKLERLIEFSQAATGSAPA